MRKVARKTRFCVQGEDGSSSRAAAAAAIGATLRAREQQLFGLMKRAAVSVYLRYEQAQGEDDDDEDEEDSDGGDSEQEEEAAAAAEEEEEERPSKRRK